MLSIVLEIMAILIGEKRVHVQYYAIRYIYIHTLMNSIESARNEISVNRL